MADTLHTRLLAEVERLRQHLVGCASCSTCESTAGYRALRAVVELHKPEPYWDHKPDGHQICKGCDAAGYDWEWPPSPCSTIRVIADALGVKDEERIEKEEQA